MARFSETPISGAGIGLRSKHYQEILRGSRIPWFEVLTENYFGDEAQRRLGGDSPYLYPFIVRKIHRITLRDIEGRIEFRHIAQRADDAVA